jgi:hypothetical protein
MMFARDKGSHRLAFGLRRVGVDLEHVVEAEAANRRRSRATPRFSLLQEREREHGSLVDGGDASRAARSRARRARRARSTRTPDELFV